MRQVASSLLSHSVDVSDSNNLKKRNDKQRYGANIAIKDLHPVVPWTHGENESHQERYQAQDP